MWCIYDLWCVVVLCRIAHTSASDIPDMSIALSGDIMLGGLFPMHEAGTGGALCGDIKEDKGIQRVEAMLYAIDQINNNQTLLPGIRLGVHILDTCLRDTVGLEQSLEFIKTHMGSLESSHYRCSDGSAPSFTQIRRVVGVIGAAASPVSIMVANILRLFKIPQISYASTGIELSDKSRFEYFSRVVPPDSYQAQVMVDVIKSFGWTYVATVADEGNYGGKGIAAFESLAEKSGACIAVSRKIPREVNDDTVVDLLKDILLFPEAKAVVMFVNEDNCKRIVQAAIKLNVTEHFTWLASDSWGAKTVPVRGQEEAAEGVVTILPQRKVLKGFDDYFLSLKMNNSRNPWWKEFWEKTFRCTQDKTIKRIQCSAGQTLQLASHTQEGLVPFVVDAVYAMAFALHQIQKDVCGQNAWGMCDNMKQIDGEQLLHNIRRVNFEGYSGEVKINKDGDASGRYTIYQYQRQKYNSGNSHNYIKVGSWSESLELDYSKIRWRNNRTKAPISVCSDPCGPGERRSSDENCCWVCIKCGPYEYLENQLTCTECGYGNLPNSNATGCVALPVQYMTLNTSWAIVPVIFSVIGITTVLFIFMVFFKFSGTPVIMASGRELCYVLLLGFLISYIMSFIMVAKPTAVTCGIQRLGLGTSLSMCYAALLTKTNRISRIFNRGIKAMVKRPSYTSPRSQIMICMTLVSVQVAGSLVWIGMEIPGTRYMYPDRNTVILTCNTTNLNIVISLIYNMLLIIMCTVYALKTRKIPENFNEAKYIAFTMYSTCIVWLAFIPTYFGTNKSDFRIQITALCMCVSISSTVAMSCLFVPKVYIVLFQPHKNVRHGKGGPSMGGRPFFAPRSGLAAMASKNGGVTSPTGLALLIAQGPKKPQTESTSTECSTIKSHPEIHSEVHYSPVKDMEDDMDLDQMSEPEPESNL